MKKGGKIALSIIVSLLIAAIFATTCAFTYIRNWNTTAFWWSWFGIVWVLDVSIGCYIFYKQNRTDETKAFWLLVMVVLPVIGAFIALIGNSGSKSLYFNPDNDHSRLQEAIFKAKKSIKIYSNSFYVTLDTFKALNFARWKGVDIQIILVEQAKKSRQDFMIENMQKYLESKIRLYVTNREVNETFIIIDDAEVLSTKSNFNFKHIYTEKNIQKQTDVSGYLNQWNKVIEYSNICSLEKKRLPVFKRFKNKIINIFYPFF